MVSICIRRLLAQPASPELETVWCGALNGLCVRSVPWPSPLALCTSECVAVIMRPVAGTVHLHAGWISIQRHNMLIYQHIARPASDVAPALLAGGLCKMLHLNFGERTLPRTSVNKGKKKDRGCSTPRPFCVAVLARPRDQPAWLTALMHCPWFLKPNSS